MYTVCVRVYVHVQSALVDPGHNASISRPWCTHASQLENIERAAVNIFATKRATGPRHFPVHAAR